MRPAPGVAALLFAVSGAVALLAWFAWTPVVARAFLDAHGALEAEGEQRYDWDDADARIHRVRRFRAATVDAGMTWIADSGFEHHPVVGVSWFGAREWTSTALKPYPYRPDDGREPWRGTGRVVVRGASHDDGATTPSLTRRRSHDRRGAAAGHPDVGFRCATAEDLGEVAPGRR